jgi:ABC-2 type transport system ATP-binding protein
MAMVIVMNEKGVYDVIEARGLTKRFGDTVAVNDLTFGVRPGVVTGFLGPNGAGKSTTMRLILGLDAPSAGSVTVNGKRYRDLAAPLHEVGALLEATSVFGRRTARQHLRWIAQAGGISVRRVDDVLEMVGLSGAAERPVGGFSLGMHQRLGIATALLGDPPVLVLDEPVNGLDPEGIVWVRRLLRRLASEGRTVFVSSHLMSEMEETADHVLVIGRGQLIADTSMAEFIQRSSQSTVRVASPRMDDLRAPLEAAGGRFVTAENGTHVVTGLEAAQIGEIAAARGIALHELSPQRARLEEAFMVQTSASVDYHAANSDHDAVVADTTSQLLGEGER